MADLAERRRRRLRVELQDEDVDVFAGDVSDETLLAEIAYARWPRVHERRRMSYGSIVLPDAGRVLRDVEAIGQVIALQDDELGRWRQYADGVTTFLVRTRGGAEGLLALDRGDELSLVRLSRAFGLTVVQRTPDDIVKIYARRRLYIHEHDLWSSKPYASSHLSTILDRVPDARTNVLGELLDFCLHILSARYVGAIIVWYHDADADTGQRRSLHRPAHPPAVDLRVTIRPHLDALAARLAQLDGACVVEPDGTLSLTEVHLPFSNRAEQEITPDGGTRHTSAKRFSYDESGALVFVVSEDGPVTVYKNGQDVLRMQLSDTGALPEVSADA